MTKNKKSERNPVAEIRENFREIKKRIKIRSEKLRDEYVKEKMNREERKIANPQRPPEVDI